MSNKFLDVTEEEIKGSLFTNEELDVLLNAHQILMKARLKGRKTE